MEDKQKQQDTQDETQEQKDMNDKKYVPDDEKVVVALLAFLFGGIGVHKFYLGRNKQGLLFLAFFWTLIPGFIAFVESILILTQNRQLV